MPVHGKTSIIHHDDKAIYQSLPNPFPATHYHSLVVEAEETFITNSILELMPLTRFESKLIGTGKPSQFGTLEEILQLSSEIEGVAPCIDFSHWHARTVKANSYQKFLGMLGQVERKLGRRGLDNMHIHVSGIAYGNKGEIKHLMLPDSDLQYAHLLKALKDRRAQGLVVCEKIPYLEQDALLLQQTYVALP